MGRDGANVIRFRTKLHDPRIRSLRDRGGRFWLKLRRVRCSQRPATIMTAAVNRQQLGILRMLMKRFTQAASVRRWSRDRQSHWGEDAHQQQYQQHSGG